jgi:hypothetical protein
MVLTGVALGAVPGFAADKSAPALACTHKSWGFLTFNGHRFGTVNTCPYAVTVWFLRHDHAPVERAVPPGAYFDTGLDVGDFSDAVWSAAICRAGRAPDLPVDEEHWNEVLNDQYRCVPR